ncbi:MAG: alpha-ketoacid dehydrogenase subunit beta, partial [Phycisphaerales bacterium]
MPQLTMAESLNLALDQSMAADDAVCVIGEDIGVNGGVFRITKGLLEKYGEDRVIDTPLAENGIIGAAVGMAIY